MRACAFVSTFARQERPSRDMDQIRSPMARQRTSRWYEMYGSLVT